MTIIDPRVLKKKSIEISCNGLPRPPPISIPTLNCNETVLKLNHQNTEIN